jgi:magnesium transporter
MLSIYTLDGQGLKRHDAVAGDEVPEGAIWIDLIEPSVEEEKKIEKFLGIEVPTREEMKEIETSSRLYEENGALYMTATLVTRLDSDLPENTQITFILVGNRLITNRYVDPLPFRRYVAYAEKHSAQCSNGASVLAGLLESIVNRIADVIERVGSTLDGVSTDIFANPKIQRVGGHNFRPILERVGQGGDMISKARETLASLGRLLVFLQQATSEHIGQDVRSRLRTVSRDISQMSDHASFLSNKTNFILDATLGMISIDQNDILKIFSVATVVLLPPSVIGAIFGMNFQIIPTTHAPWGFAAALAMMLVSAIVPLVIFKRRGWL